MSAERRLWLKFVSDGSGQGKGFRLLFAAVPSSRASAAAGRRRTGRRNRQRSSSRPRRRQSDRKNINVANVTATENASRPTRRRSKSGRKRRRKQQNWSAD